MTRINRLRGRLEDLGLDVTALDDYPMMPIPPTTDGYLYHDHSQPQSPLTWEQLENIILVQQDFAKLTRSAEQQQDYEIVRYLLQQQYTSVLDYILISKFGLDKRKSIQQQQQKWQSYPSLQDYALTRKVLVPNDFPYFLAEDIVHYILWKTKEGITTQDIETAKEELTLKLEGVVDTLHWINPPHLQSMPDIEHVHILCRVRVNSTGTVL